MKHKTAWAALLAVVALIVHLAVPLMHADGETYSRAEWLDVEASQDPVPGASMLITLVGLVTLVAGLGGAWLLRHQHMGRLTMGFVAAIGAGLTVRSQALWSGRGVATAIHAVLGSDGPPARFAALGNDHFGSVVPIAPPMVLALTTVAVVWLLKDLADDRIHVEHATRHTRPALWMFVVLLLVPAMPWAIEETADANSTDAAQDLDLFMISAYDASRLHLDTSARADATGEAGLSEYDEVAWVHGATLVLFLLAAALAMLGLAGLWRTELEDKYLGRTLETTGAALHLVVGLAAAFAVVVVAVFLYGANDRTESDPAWAPLLTVVPSLLVLPAAVATLRRLSADQDRLIADRFPEPVIYD